MIDLHSPGFFRDPYSTYRRLRHECPFYLDEPSRSWFISRYADVVSILRQPALFSARNASFEQTLLGVDGPKHATNRRSLIDQSRHWRHRLTKTVAERTATLLARRATEDVFDLVDDYAAPLSVAVISDILGLTESDHAMVSLYSERMLHENIVDCFRADVSSRLQAIRMTDADCLPNVWSAGGALEESEIVDLCMLLIIAATQTTKNLIGCAMLHALTRPEIRQTVASDDHALSSFIEEVLRHDSPVQRISRMTMAPFEHGEIVIPAGSFVNLLIGAANRDESVFKSADTFDMGRAPNAHIAFGAGAHFCLGSQLTRLEAFLAIRAFIERYPNATLVEQPDDDRCFQTHPMIRGPSQLRVRLEGMR